MSDVFTNRAGPASATHPGKPEGTRMLCDTKTEPMAERSWNGTRASKAEGRASRGEGSPQEPPRIRIDVPDGHVVLGDSGEHFSPGVATGWHATPGRHCPRHHAGHDLTGFATLRSYEGLAAPRFRRLGPWSRQLIGSSGHRAIGPSTAKINCRIMPIGRSGDRVSR